MTTNLHDKMLAAIDALFSASNEIEAHIAEEQLLDVRAEINKYKLAAESLSEGLRLDDWDKIGCVNHDCDQCKALAEQPAQQEPVAEVKAKMTGGNVGIATVIHEIHSPLREPLQPGDKLYAAYRWIGWDVEQVWSERIFGIDMRFENVQDAIAFREKLDEATTPQAQPAQQAAAVMPCGAVVSNVYEAYEAGKKAQPQPAREPLTDEQIDLLINGRGEEGDDDYVEPTGDGFGLTDADLVRLVRRVEAAYGITGSKT